jgi:tetratricopeptide (TPR) repeat protein
MDSDSAYQQYVDAARNGLRYFQRLAQRQPENEAIAALDARRQNLYQLVQEALAFPELWADVAAVILQAFPLVRRRGYWREWTPITRQAVDAHRGDHSDQVIALLNILGQLYRLDNQFAQAIDTHLQAEMLALQLGDELWVAKTRCNLLGDYLDNRQYAIAEQYGLQSLPILQQQGAEPRWISSVLEMLGKAAAQRGELDLAESRVVEAISIWRLTNETTEVARSLNELANIFLMAQRFEEALRCYEEAAELLTASVNELYKVAIDINLGTLYFHNERWSEAEVAFRRADSAYLHGSTHYSYQASVANGLGNVLMKKGHYLEATLYLEEAIKLWRTIGDEVSLAVSIGTLGEVKECQEQPPSALSLYSDAIVLFERHPDSAIARSYSDEYKAKRDELLKK